MPLNGLVRDHGGWEAWWNDLDRCSERAGLPEAMRRRWRAATDHEGAGAITLLDEGYPAGMRDLPDAPPVLFVEGEVGVLSSRALAVVGTRRATPYGVQVARDIGQRAATGGLVVVSGLARGIDAAAHEGALVGGITVAVVAHGLSHTAPAGHRSLRRRIVAGGGALVTTHLAHEPPRPWTFPVRNRWIAGLSVGVVVVEAPRKSGALHTVRAAADYGREVFAVPGPLGRASHEGALQLLAEGATPVVSTASLVAQLTGAAEGATSWVDEVVAGRALGEVARACGRSLAELIDELDMMEATGELVRLPGQRYARGV
jgi:DNA processing protein